MELRIERTSEFNEWLKGLNSKEQLLIDSRIQRIRDHGHFGDAKSLGDGLAELRWKTVFVFIFRKQIPS